MKLEIKEGSENYACTIVKLPTLQDVVGLDNLKKVTVFGNDVLVSKNSTPTALYIFFPAECKIDPRYLRSNNEFREVTLNEDGKSKGFFEPTGRVKAIKFKGVISTGYLAPVESLEGLRIKWEKLNEGDEFTTIDGIVLCEKYKRINLNVRVTKESRFNKRLDKFDKLVKNQFRFHTSTNHLAKNLHVFQPDDIIVITDKWHGTSAVFGNVLIKKQLALKDKVAKWLGANVVETVYDNLFSSRSVIKNQYINKDVTPGFYGEDVWVIINEELKGKIEQGITIYGEIVGFTPGGKTLQKDYDYGCEAGQHKFVVYRITYTKPDGAVIELSWQQIKDYCFRYQLDTVKEIYFGPAKWLITLTGSGTLDFGESLFASLTENLLEKDCKHCKLKVPAEGVVVRQDGRETYQAFKLKSKRFLEKETKDLDKGVEDMEADQ